jgi:hypothetical protein
MWFDAPCPAPSFPATTASDQILRAVVARLLEAEALQRASPSPPVLAHPNELTQRVLPQSRFAGDQHMASLRQTIPALPVRNTAAAVDFYRDKLGFEVLHHDAGLAVLCRDDAVLHLWEASDETWSKRQSLERPVRSGAESFIAGRPAAGSSLKASTSCTRRCAKATSSIQPPRMRSRTLTSARGSSPPSTSTAISSRSSSGQNPECSAARAEGLGRNRLRKGGGGLR